MWAQVGNAAAPITYSDVEENRLVSALHADVETIGGLAAAGLLVGNEGAAAIGRHQREDRIGAVGHLVGKIQPRIDLPQHAAREDADHDMRRLARSFGALHRARLDGIETEDAILV